MNKNEAKNLKVNDVVEAKVDGTRLVVSDINEYEDGKFDITAIDMETGAPHIFKHVDLKVTGDTANLPDSKDNTADAADGNKDTADIPEEKENMASTEKTAKVGRKARNPKYDLVEGSEFTQEEYDNMSPNAKRNVTIENTVVFKDPDNEGKFLSKTVGSNMYVSIEASNLNNAKRVRNSIG